MQNKNRTNPETAEQRFWKKINKNGPTQAHVPELGPCWEWLGSISSNGAGQLWIGDKNWIASQYSWILHHGEIPKGLFVLHHCDCRSCTNPKHLFLGTLKINADDMVQKHRQHKQAVTHCPQGHPYDKENTQIYQERRYCKACKRASWNDYKKHGRTNTPNAEKTHCPQGHPYNKENTYTDHNGMRHCRVCRRIHDQKRNRIKMLRRRLAKSQPQL